MTCALVLFALAALILAAGTVALWSRSAPGWVRLDEVPRVHRATASK